MRFLIAIAVVALAVSAEVCTVPGVGTGACITTSQCSSKGGKSYAGHCAGASNIQCCTGIVCGGTGLCMQKSECTGTVVTGLCPGPNGFVCCKNIPCDAGKGKCMPSSQCSGKTVAGKCPGPSGYTCCEGSSPGPTPTGGGDKIVSAAKSMVGRYPYSWGGGNNNGATVGIKQTISPYCDDRKVVGFDCSGLSKYSVYQGTGKSMDHYAQTQYSSCPKRLPLSDKQPGDLVFFGSSASSITHVAIYIGNNQMVEAPGHNPDCSGIKVRQTSLRTSKLISQVCRMW